MTTTTFPPKYNPSPMEDYKWRYYIYKNVIRPWVDIRAYLPSGFVTDGSVDYTTYVQTAFATAKPILIPNITIQVTTSIAVNTGQLVMGFGSKSIIYNNSDYSCLVASSGSTEIYIGNLKILGNANPVSPVGGRGAVWFSGVSNSIIENLWIEDVNTGGVSLGDSANMGTNLVVNNIIIKNTHEHGIYLGNIDGANISNIRGIDIAQNLGGGWGGGFGVKISDSDNIVLNNAYINNVYQGGGIVVEAPNASTSGSNVSINNCVGLSPDAGHYGLYFTNDISNVTVNGGYFEGDYGIRFNGSAGHVPSNISINGTNSKCNGTAYAVDVAWGNNITINGGHHTGAAAAYAVRSRSDATNIRFDGMTTHGVYGYDIDNTSTYVTNPIHRGTDVAFETYSFTDADTTPSVSKGNGIFKTSNTAGTTISMFDDGYETQVIKVIINDINTTIDFTGTNLKGNAGVDWSPTTGDHMTCTFDGTDWYCDISDNTA